jgi:prepilin-type N-terminal cleavage/methylation domain-containing protein
MFYSGHYVTTKTKKAFSFIELILVIAVIGVLSALVMQHKDTIFASVYEQRESNNIVMLHMTVQDRFGGNSGYSGLTNSLAKGFATFPRSMEAGEPNAISTAWSEYGVDLRPETDRSLFQFGSSNNNTFSMTYYNVPASACNRLVNDHESLFYQIEINGTTVKDNSRANTSSMGSSAVEVSTAKVAQECGFELDVNTIKFYSR